MKHIVTSVIISIFLSACGGGGGGGSVTPPVIVKPTPIAVMPSSYENKTKASQLIGPQIMPSEVNLSNTVAFADFYQDGSYSMVTHSLEYDRNNIATSNQVGVIRFYTKINGTWVDNTNKLLTNTTGCIHPRKAIVSDFNGDGKPDVFFACHGFDANPYTGEHPHMLLSQTDGTYTNITLPIVCYCHSATASDSSGKGFSDILVTDNQANAKIPYFLINTHDGKFSQDFTRLPFNPDIYSVPNTNYGAVVLYTTELIDFNQSGKYDAFIAGTEAPDDQSGIPPTIFKNDGTGHYMTAVQLPTDSNYATTLDILFVNGIIYLNKVQTNGGAYGFSSIQKIDYASMTKTNIYNNTSNFQNGMTWLNWIIEYNGKIESTSSIYMVSVSK